MKSSDLVLSEVIFVGGISEKKKWLNNGKKLSRNYRQGNRVYSADGIATTLSAQPVGGTGGCASLYLVNEKQEGKDKVQNNIYNNNKQANLNKVFTYASLFSGIGGFEQALNRLGGKCVFASEIDKFASQAYEVLYGRKPHGDITQIEASDVPDHDLLVGGFPCQAFSVAGQRKGFDDTRGTLFFEVARIAKEKQPKALLLENVKGLVNHDKGKTLDVIFETLNEIGYTVDFEVLNSKYFGVPQNRERIFIVAIRDDLIETEKWTEDQTNGQTVVAKGKRRISDYEWAKIFNFDYPEQLEVEIKLKDILEGIVDEKYYLDENKTKKLIGELEEKDKMNSAAGNYNSESDNDPQLLGHVDIKGYDSMITTMGGGHREPKIAEEQIPQWIPKPNEINRTVRSGGKSSLTEKHNWDHIAEEIRPVLTPERLEKRQNGRRFKEDGEEMFTITSQDRHGVAIAKQPTERMSQQAIEVFNNNECEYGDMVHAFRREVIKDGISPTISTRPDGFKTAPLPVTKEYRIRKLTPKECWRLQGFPDEAHDAVEKVGISDSQRYKMAGNAVTVNVIEVIGERLLPYIIKK